MYNRIRDLREDNSLSQKQLAEILGISDYFMTETESGRKGCSFTTLCKLSESLHVTTDYLLTGKEPEGNISNIVSMLSTIDDSLISGAEDLLKTYLNTISYIKAKVKSELKKDSDT